jgi:hypothetical protein
MCTGTPRVHSSNIVPSQVSTLAVPDVPGSARSDFRRFSAVLFNFGRFYRRYAPKTHTVPRFLGWYGTLHSYEEEEASVYGYKVLTFSRKKE